MKVLRKSAWVVAFCLALGLAGCGGQNEADPSRFYLKTIAIPASTSASVEEDTERTVKLEFYNSAVSVSEPAMVKSFELAPEQKEVVVNGLEKGVSYQVKGYVFSGDSTNPIQVFTDDSEQ